MGAGPPSFYGGKMTEQEELAYLVQMGLDASEYRLEPGENHDAIYYEYQARVKRLLESVTARKAERRAAVSKTMAISVHGKRCRYPIEWLEKVPFKGSPTGYRWALKKEFENEGCEKI